VGMGGESRVVGRMCAWRGLTGKEERGTCSLSRSLDGDRHRPHNEKTFGMGLTRLFVFHAFCFLRFLLYVSLCRDCVSKSCLDLILTCPFALLRASRRVQREGGNEEELERDRSDDEGEKIINLMM